MELERRAFRLPWTQRYAGFFLKGGSSLDSLTNARYCALFVESCLKNARCTNLSTPALFSTFFNQNSINIERFAYSNLSSYDWSFYAK